MDSTGQPRWTCTLQREAAHESSRTEDRPTSSPALVPSGCTCQRPNSRCIDSSTAAKAGVCSGSEPTR